MMHLLHSITYVNRKAHWKRCQMLGLDFLTPRVCGCCKSVAITMNRTQWFTVEVWGLTANHMTRSTGCPENRVKDSFHKLQWFELGWPSLPPQMCKQIHKPIPIQVGAITKNGYPYSRLRIEAHYCRKIWTTTCMFKITFLL